MLELFKLRASHIFTSSKRLAKHFRAIAKDEEALNESVNAKINELKENFSEGGEPEAIDRKLREAVKELQKYYSEIVFRTEEDADLYIFRDEQDILELYRGLYKVFEHLKKALPQDQEDAQAIAKLLNEIHEEGKKLSDIINQSKRKMRDQKRQHERFRDHVYQLRQEFKQRHAGKELRRGAKKHSKLNKHEEKEAKELEDHLARIEELTKKQEQQDKLRKKELEKVHEITEDLAKDVTQDLKLLEDVLQDVRLVLNYAVLHFFHAKEFEQELQQAVQGIPGLFPENRALFQNIIKTYLLDWEQERQRKEYRLMKKLKRRTRKNAHQQASV
ncbi:MAG: hypothetical protein ACLFO2_02320 [Candidatus Woesearchaeota archaeon]